MRFSRRKGSYRKLDKYVKISGGESSPHKFLVVTAPEKDSFHTWTELNISYNTQ
jgi:hypothetical protein